MKRKFLSKIITTLVVVVMSTMVLSGCGKKEGNPGAGKVSDNFNATGYPVVKEGIKIKAFTQVDPQNSDYNEMTMLKNLNEKTGVKVEYECITGSVWNEKKNLVLASNDLPDIFFGGGLADSDVIKYGSQGVLIPLEELIEKYAPNIKKVFAENPEVKKSSMAADGHIYTLPYVDGYLPEDITTHIYINKKWLDKLGLKEPATTEEFQEVLRAFKEKDPNGNGKKDEIPLSYRADNVYNGDLSLAGSFGVVDNLEHLMIKDGKMLFSPMEEGYKDHIKWLNTMFKEGLVDKEVFTQDQGQYLAKGKNDVLGSFIIYGSENIVGEEKAISDYVCLKPLKGPRGDQLWGRYVKGIRPHKFAITKDNKSPEATIRWVDEFFSEEFGVEVHLGELGKVIEKADGKYKVVTPPKGVSSSQFKFQSCPGPYAPGVISKEVYENKLIQNESANRKTQAYKLYDEFATKEPLPILNFTNGDLQEISVIKTDIDNYVKEMKAKWITGQVDIESTWDKYVKKLKEMGADKYVEMYQKAYEKYKKN